MFKIFQSTSGDGECLENVQKKMPRRVKKRRKIETDDGVREVLVFHVTVFTPYYAIRSLCVLIYLSKFKFYLKPLQIDFCYFSSLMLAGKNTMITYFPMTRIIFLTLNFYKWQGYGNKTKLNSNEDMLLGQWLFM